MPRRALTLLLLALAVSAASAAGDQVSAPRSSALTRPPAGVVSSPLTPSVWLILLSSLQFQGAFDGAAGNATTTRRLDRRTKVS